MTLFNWGLSRPTAIEQSFAMVAYGHAMELCRAQCEGEDRHGNARMGGAPALLVATREMVNKLSEVVR